MLTLTLPQPLESRLRGEAMTRGLAAEEYAQRILEERLLPAAVADKGNATMNLLAQWDAEDATTDPAEIQRRREQWEEFKQSMNEHSLSDRPIYP